MNEEERRKYYEQFAKPASTCPKCGHVGLVLFPAAVVVEKSDGALPSRVLLEHHVQCPECGNEGIITTFTLLMADPTGEVDRKFAVYDAEMLLRGAGTANDHQ